MVTEKPRECGFITWTKQFFKRIRLVAKLVIKPILLELHECLTKWTQQSMSTHKLMALLTYECMSQHIAGESGNSSQYWFVFSTCHIWTNQNSNPRKKIITISVCVTISIKCIVVSAQFNPIIKSLVHLSKTLKTKQIIRKHLLSLEYAILFEKGALEIKVRNSITRYCTHTHTSTYWRHALKLRNIRSSVEDTWKEVNNYKTI